MNMETKYKNVLVTYDEHLEKFTVNDENIGDYANEKLSKIKEWIDRKQKAPFKRAKALIMGYDSVQKVTLTSIADEYGSPAYWTVDESGGRRKYNKNYTCAYDEALYAELQALKQEEAAFAAKVKARFGELKRRLRPFEPEVTE